MLQFLLNAIPSNIGGWIYLIVFLASAAESALLVGLVVPGETMLLFAGVLASRGEGSVGIYMLVAVVGAIVGDSIGYELGRHLGPRLRSGFIGRAVGDQRWERADHYLRDRGGRAIFFGRWVAVVRAIVPALAGEARMPYRRFLKWNVAGAVVVGVLHVGLGYLAGESYRVVDHYLGIGTWAFLGVLLVIGGVYWWRRRRSRRATHQHERV
ncbi:MAG: DedA family protein [Acidimicrobiales bacterium]|jgi:membrane protein DedA with SNARE-associated domain|nr:DedA family protein [Acidimicrobiales bacterium]